MFPFLAFILIGFHFIHWLWMETFSNIWISIKSESLKDNFLCDVTQSFMFYDDNICLWSRFWCVPIRFYGDNVFQWSSLMNILWQREEIMFHTWTINIIVYVESSVSVDVFWKIIIYLSCKGHQTGVARHTDQDAANNKCITNVNTKDEMGLLMINIIWLVTLLSRTQTLSSPVSHRK